jgi:uncharacterized protein (DUF2062 family)
MSSDMVHSRFTRLTRPFVDLLRQGITPEKVALTIALGIAIGVTPVLGSTTGLCALAAIALRLNLPAIQLVNWFTYPLQLVLIIPFLRIGAWLFGDRQLPGLTLSRIFELIRTNILHAIATLGSATLHALVAWLLIAAVVTALLYALLLPVLKMLWRREVASTPNISS